jgi:hypothetical protein
MMHDKIKLIRGKSVSIGNACEKSIKAAKIALESQAEISNYCNEYAKSILNDPSFELTVLPDDIVQKIFYGFGEKPSGGWAEYLKQSIRDYLDSSEHCVHSRYQ